MNGASGSTFAYFFDCGIIVRGLLSAWRVTEDTEFRDAAIAGGRAMLADFPSDEGLNPILALPEKRPVGVGAALVRESGMLSAKIRDGLAGAVRSHRRERVSDVATNRRSRPRSRTIPSSCPARGSAACDGPAARVRLFPGRPAAGARSAGVRRGLSRWRGSRRPLLARDRARFSSAPMFTRRCCASGCWAKLRAALPLDRSAAAHEAERVATFQIAPDGFRGDPRLAGGFLVRP